ncbi:MAG: circularly permuted type 2 ATP-grasp protein [Caldilineaceae bacterium]
MDATDSLTAAAADVTNIDTAAKETIPPFLQAYTPAPTTFDELWRGQQAAPSAQLSDAIQPHWQGVIHTFAALGTDGIANLQQEALRMLRDNGVTYNVHGVVDGHQRPWPLDLMPLVLTAADWVAIAAGVQQRAHLLNLILADLYGARTLLRQGLLPPELIYGHHGFLRACHGVQLPGKTQLLLYAADLTRRPDGRMWVLGDRTQAPSGAGYALENRTVMARLLRGAFRDGKIERLANFFARSKVHWQNIRFNTRKRRARWC